MNILVTKWNGEIKPNETVIINTDHFIRAEPFETDIESLKVNKVTYTQIFMTEGRFVTPMTIADFYRKLENDV